MSTTTSKAGGPSVIFTPIVGGSIPINTSWTLELGLSLLPTMGREERMYALKEKESDEEVTVMEDDIEVNTNYSDHNLTRLTHLAEGEPEAS